MSAEASLRTIVKSMLRNRWRWLRWLWPLALCAAAHAQVCQGPADMDASTRTALETTATRYLDMAEHGDVAALKQNSIAAVAASFAGIEEAVKDNHAALTGARGTVRPPFLLIVEGTQALGRAEFLCGVFGATGQTMDSAVFVLNDLPPGKYGVTIVDVNGDKGARTLTFVLQQAGTDWKLAGFYARTGQVAGHDA